MEVFRFMSKKEFIRLSDGETLEPYHRNHKARTSSKGFCFMATQDFTPEYAYNFLSCIVSENVCVLFEVPEDYLQESSGVYADPEGEWDDVFVAREYCCNEYSRDTFVPRQYTCDVGMSGKWQWYEFH